MKKAEILSFVILVYSVLFNKAVAIEQIFNIRGDAPIETILEKVGAPKGSSTPIAFENGKRDIKVEVVNNKERIVSISFSPPSPFTVTDKDLFEKIEIKDSGDRVNHILVIADPQSGRIWKLTSDLTVSQLDLVPPWVSKKKMYSLKEILAEMGQTKIIKVHKNLKKKVETKK